MPTWQWLFLAFIAGATIFLGLPIGRVKNPSQRLQLALVSLTIGILLFLLYDVLANANEPVETALQSGLDGYFAGLATVGIGGIGVGVLGLSWYQQWSNRRSRSRASPARPASYQLAGMIATGIGLHNFAEGLAIGQAVAKDEISLAWVLIVGFGLHNATEGFGIVGPMSGEQQRPSWGFLATLGVVGGLPTFVGAIVGHAFINTAVFVGFLALAAGSIIFVIGMLYRVVERIGQKLAPNSLAPLFIFLGLVLGFVTDYVLIGAGV